MPVARRKRGSAPDSNVIGWFFMGLFSLVRRAVRTAVVFRWSAYIYGKDRSEFSKIVAQEYYTSGGFAGAERANRQPRSMPNDKVEGRAVRSVSLFARLVISPGGKRVFNFDLF